eukprot:scaffold186786_cov15-Tisochrysis_lutea.AAC.2
MREKIVSALLALLYFALPSTQADVYVLVSNMGRADSTISQLPSPSIRLVGVTPRALLQNTGQTRLQTKSYILEPLPSLQADFGPPISAEGVDGVLR